MRIEQFSSWRVIPLCPFLSLFSDLLCFMAKQLRKIWRFQLISESNYKRFEVLMKFCLWPHKLGNNIFSYSFLNFSCFMAAQSRAYSFLFKNLTKLQGSKFWGNICSWPYRLRKKTKKLNFLKYSFCWNIITFRVCLVELKSQLKSNF